MSKITNKKTKVLGLSMLGVLAAGGILAYFTDTETKENKFKVGNVDITLAEPSWVETDANANGIPDASEGLTPLKQVAKDPQITNEGENDAYVYLQVDIPTRLIKAIGADGLVPDAPASNPLFTLNGVSEKWELLSTTTSTTVSETEGTTTLVYGYKNKLVKAAATDALFTSVTFLNIPEGTAVKGSELNVVVTAKAIQADDTGTMQEAYTKYVNQNK